MKTKVGDILQHKGTEVVSTSPTTSVYEAIRIMVHHNIGAVVVEDGGGLLGIFTERDILRECERRWDKLKETPLASVMTTELIIGLPDDEVDYLMGVMTENRIRHVPILKEGQIHGLVSIGDLVKSQMRDVEHENRYLKDYISGKYPK